MTTSTTKSRATAKRNAIAVAPSKPVKIIKTAKAVKATQATEPPEPPIRRDDLQVGGRLRHARLLSGVLMRELANKVGCTESMVSKIESGRVVPSLPMLQRLVEALGRDLASFFGSDPNSPALVMRVGQRLITNTDPIRQGFGVSYERLVPFGAGNLLEGNIHVVEPDAKKHDPITHQGETLGYLLEGQLELTVEKTSYSLAVGDSFFFKNHLTNSYRNTSAKVARVLWVNTPQVH
ncbi:cupin domain-containing protein [Variovorax sp. RTB1]|uniref:cupin domain-containing protein n=1 Tax=Variovorax sp. RTB1 TaxID=3048631 RepID=UPI002B23BFA1|nr:cupin domain-containing protein [Variovorax sp. RTB1]MEB0112495.1 cupin domain-containing protein [Variovorax sp. RTB1]